MMLLHLLNQAQAFTLNSFVGGSFFLIPNVSADAEAGADGRVLIGQFTTDGVVDLTVNLQWDDVDHNTSNSLGVFYLFPICSCVWLYQRICRQL